MPICITFRYSTTYAEPPETLARYVITNDCLQEPRTKAAEIATRILDGTDACEGCISMGPARLTQTPVHVLSSFRSFAGELRRLLPEWFYFCELESNTLLFLMLAVVRATNTRPEVLHDPRSDILVDVCPKDFEQFLTEVSEASREFYESEAHWEERFEQVKRYFRLRNYGHPVSLQETPEMIVARKAWQAISELLGLTASERATARWEILDGLPHVIVRRQNGEWLVSYFEDQTGYFDMYWAEGFASTVAEAEWRTYSGSGDSF